MFKNHDSKPRLDPEAILDFGSFVSKSEFTHFSNIYDMLNKLICWRVFAYYIILPLSETSAASFLFNPYK